MNFQSHFNPETGRWFIKSESPRGVAWIDEEGQQHLLKGGALVKHLRQLTMRIEIVGEKLAVSRVN